LELDFRTGLLEGGAKSHPEAVQSVCDPLNQRIMDAIRLYLQIRSASTGLDSAKMSVVWDGIAQDL
jgi:hypothetical protein